MSCRRCCAFSSGGYWPIGSSSYSLEKAKELKRKKNTTRRWRTPGDMSMLYDSNRYMNSRSHGTTYNSSNSNTGKKRAICSQEDDIQPRSTMASGISLLLNTIKLPITVYSKENTEGLELNSKLIYLTYATY